MARQPEAALAGVPRVNLMPRSETDRRERESLVRKWVWGVLGVIIVAFLIAVGALGLTWVADQRLAASQTETNTLLTKLAGLSDINQALANERELTQFRSEAVGADFAWAPVIGTVSGVLPAGSTLTGFDVTAGGEPATKPEDAVGLTGTFTFSSATPVDMGATIRAVRSATGVMYADGESITAGNAIVGSYEYELTVTFNQTIYSGKYAQKAAK